MPISSCLIVFLISRFPCADKESLSDRLEAICKTMSRIKFTPEAKFAYTYDFVIGDITNTRNRVQLKSLIILFRCLHYGTAAAAVPLEPLSLGHFFRCRFTRRWATGASNTSGDCVFVCMAVIPVSLVSRTRNPGFPSVV